jgi:hypothetical protein
MSRQVNLQSMEIRNIFAFSYTLSLFPGINIYFYKILIRKIKILL